MCEEVWEDELILNFGLCTLTVVTFGVDLSAQFSDQSQKAPTVVLKCIEAVETRGRCICHDVMMMSLSLCI